MCQTHSAPSRQLRRQNFVTACRANRVNSVYMLDFKYILMLFLAASVAACQSPRAAEDRLVAAFGETMFGGRVHSQDGISEDGKEFRLAKWDSSVEISVMDGATAENLAFVQDTLEPFAELTELRIRLAEPNDESADIRIYFSDQKDFVINDNEPAKCFAQSRSDDHGRLVMAEVHISRTDEETWRTECLVHELLHAFGWRGHTHRVRSAISYMHGETELTRWDDYLMRTLYDPRMEFGMSRNDAMPVARTILHELMNEG
ncbi:MAG: DUF2927 domain-containing protein [Rhodospirillales bacterium]|nr:MAG: DUF2927 domain-containing protein [Rhodospirillales bacterium]